MHKEYDLGRLLLDAYIKVLRINLTEDSFEEIKVDDAEKDTALGYGQTISEWFHRFADSGNVIPEDCAKYKAFTDLKTLRQTFADGRDSISLLYRRRNDAGIFRWVRMTLRRSYDYTETHQMVMLYIEDVDDMISMTHEVSEQKQITESLVDMYFTCLYIDMDDNTYQRIHVAEGFEKWVPESGNMLDIVKLYVDRLVVPNDIDSMLQNFSVPMIRQRLRTQNSFDYEYWAKKEESQIWCRIVAIVVDRHEDGNPHHVILAMQDVTTQAESIAHTNAMLKEAFSAAVAANTAKSEFMSRMSHDIRTPLNGIIGMTAIAGAHLDDKERIADSLTKIAGAGKHLLALINDILDLSKIESGKVNLTDAEFNLPALIDDLLGMVHTQLDAHQHELKVNIRNVTHENVIGDNVRLQQVFLNLLSNAIKYTPDHGNIQITLSELPSSSANIGQFRFICEDNGYGMSKEFQERLFEPFERASDECVDGIQGTGLGMTITRNIINMMGGDIRVESKENVGSRFTVDFKIKLQNEENLQSDDLIDLPVLVVDDDEVTCESACITLNELGMKGSYCLSGAEAVDLVQTAHESKNDFFACLIDWKMPEIDGFETTRRIRKIVGPDVTIIIISAYEWDDIEEEARKAGADAFISKPLFKSRLYAAFTELPKSMKTTPDTTTLESFHRKDYSNKRLLLVEDNELNREIAEEILRSTGAAVESAENGKRAVEMFEASAPGYYDMVFMDIRMPVMNGYEAARAIRSLERPDSTRVPIIALTADAFVEDVAHVHEAGMNRHMAKPIDLNILLAVMEEELE